MNETDVVPPITLDELVESSDTPIADSVLTFQDVVKAVNTMGEQLNWLCESHYNILQTVGAIQEKMSSMGPGGMLKAMMGGGKP